MTKEDQPWQYDYIHFRPSLIDKLGTELIKPKKRGKTLLRYIIQKLEKAENRVVEKDVVEELNNILPYSIDNYIYCYVEGKNDIIEAVNLDNSFYKHVEEKISYLGNTSMVKKFYENEIVEKGKKLVPKKELYRFSILMKEDFRPFIRRTIVYTNKIEKPLHKDEVKAKIYKIARYLSNEYNRGYKIKYDENTLILESEDKYYLELTYHEDTIYHKKEAVANLKDSFVAISRKLDKKFKNYIEFQKYQERRTLMEKKFNERRLAAW